MNNVSGWTDETPLRRKIAVSEDDDPGMTSPVAMAEVFRGDFLESVHMGHAVVARADGSLHQVWGDADQVVLPRSAIKMIQAIPMVESGAGAHLTPEQLALACASHAGEARHVAAVAEWLGDLGMDEHALCCGPQPSRDPALFSEMIRRGETPTRLHNNCSGKHTGFLTLTRHLGAGPDYVDPDHPVQKAVKEAFEDMTGLTSPGFAIDGCSAPNYATTLVGLARAMAKFAEAGQGGGARDRAAATLRDAMMARPEWMSGKGKTCAEIISAAGGRAAVKTGAEGVYIAILPELGLGVALKITDGATRASELALVAILVRLGVLNPKHPLVARYLERPVVNWAGLVTGAERPAPELLG